MEITIRTPFDQINFDLPRRSYVFIIGPGNEEINLKVSELFQKNISLVIRSGRTQDIDLIIPAMFNCKDGSVTDEKKREIFIWERKYFHETLNYGTALFLFPPEDVPHLNFEAMGEAFRAHKNHGAKVVLYVDKKSPCRARLDDLCGEIERCPVSRTLEGAVKEAIQISSIDRFEYRYKVTKKYQTVQ